MVAFNKINSFSEALAEKIHNLGSDQIKVALCAAANAPVAGNTKLSDLTEISYTNLSSRNVTTTSSAQSAGTYKLTLVDLVLTATGAVGPFRYVVLYNDTATNKELIGWYDYGSDLSMVSGNSFTVDFDGSAGVLTLV
ncbi:MAG: hypothetical protein EOQ55_24920 [Mesorhizobium sp.]|uniref:hypothetical protein n=1 Tax=Mesorhizobium sp. TaxID=1871066 RepID=UPI000FE9DB77|nr:hypothetical protein [Mesorhizobium sp.]RWG13744.1 MAG: hypothetical protein EOQ55_24920 [Mesorhizobium sp.]